MGGGGAQPASRPATAPTSAVRSSAQTRPAATVHRLRVACAAYWREPQQWDSNYRRRTAGYLISYPPQHRSAYSACFESRHRMADSLSSWAMSPAAQLSCGASSQVARGLELGVGRGGVQDRAELRCRGLLTSCIYFDSSPVSRQTHRQYQEEHHEASGE